MIMVWGLYIVHQNNGIEKGKYKNRDNDVRRKNVNNKCTRIYTGTQSFLATVPPNWKCVTVKFTFSYNKLYAE